MKIAYITNQYPLTSHSFVRREINSLEKQGIDIFRVSIRDTGKIIISEDDLNEYEDTFKILKSFKESPFAVMAGILVLSVGRPIRTAKSLIISLALSEAGLKSKILHIVYFLEAIIFTKAVLEWQAKHIHAHFGTNSTTVAMLASNLSGVPFSFTVHGPEEFDRPDSLKLREKISAARFVVAISSYGRSQLMRWSETSDWSKLIVVRCGIERSFYEEYDESVPETNSFVCVGRLCEQKGQVLLIEAVKNLVSNGCSIHLTLVGDGDMRPDIEQTISKYGLQDHVTITGWLDGEGVREQILRSRALVLPSFAEGLPVVLMEAMALKRPVISTYVAGIPELVENGHSGWLVPAGSIDQLGDAIYQVLNTPIDELRSIGEAARARVVRQHDVDDQAAILIQNFSRRPELRQDELVQ